MTDLGLSFAKRQDGSYLMVCRGGGIGLVAMALHPMNSSLIIGCICR